MNAFIAVEGVDGAGCGTQAGLLREHLADTGFDTELVRYPDYSHPLGSFIKQYLTDGFALSAEAEMLLYAADMVKDREHVFDALNEGVVVADRYLPSTLAYQSANGVAMEQILHFVKLFNLPTPTLVVYLDVDVDTAQQRKEQEKEELDRYERDAGFRGQVRQQYKTLVTEEPLHAAWVEIDASQGIDTVQEHVQTVVDTHLADQAT